MRRWAEYAAEDEAEEEAGRAYHMDLVEVHAELAQRGADEAEEEAGRAFHTDLVKVHAELAQRCAGGGLLPLSSGSSVLGGVEIGGRARASSCSGAFAPQQLIRAVASAFREADLDATDDEDSGGGAGRVQLCRGGS